MDGESSGYLRIALHSWLSVVYCCAVQMEELDDVLCGVSPTFADESRSGREQELYALLAQVHSLNVVHSALGV